MMIMKKNIVWWMEATLGLIRILYKYQLKII